MLFPGPRRGLHARGTVPAAKGGHWRCLQLIAAAPALRRPSNAPYAAGLDDYHLEPMVLTENGVPVGRIRDHDAVVFCCRRGEREVELTEMFTDPDLAVVERRRLDDLYFSILTLYHDKFKNLPVAFAPEHVKLPLAQVLSQAGKTQFHCAESEKFAHVTFFFNGGENAPLLRRGRRVHPLSQGHRL